MRDLVILTCLARKELIKSLQVIKSGYKIVGKSAELHILKKPFFVRLDSSNPYIILISLHKNHTKPNFPSQEY